MNKDRLDHIELPDVFPKELIPLGQYSWPASQTRQTIGPLLSKARAHLWPSAKTSVSPASLSARSGDQATKHAQTLLSRWTNNLLDTAYLDWLAHRDAAIPRVFVAPPLPRCLLAEWAAQRGVPVAAPDTFSDLPAKLDRAVLPSLEQFFIRSAEGMTPAHDALSQLASVAPRAVISCNSWAYQFVQTFDDLAAHLGPCLTIPAFDATALAALMRQATQLAKDQSQFLSADSGDNIFETNEDGIPTDPFFKHLAHRSLGHPWVAVAMFEAATQQHTETETDASRSTTWVRPPEAPELPAQFERHMRFALQALLLHGPREEEALMRSLPTEVPPAIWSLLETAGFVCRTPDHVRIQMTAYPTIRAELGTAGFNLDRL